MRSNRSVFIFLLAGAIFGYPGLAFPQGVLTQLDSLLDAKAVVPEPPQASAPAPASPLKGKYAHIDPEGIIPPNLLSDALDYYDSNLPNIPNRKYLSVIDFRRHATVKRLFIIDMSSGEVEAMRVAHGTGSDPDSDGMPDVFGNKPKSKMSSLGFYRTADVYYGKFGKAMRLDGLSKSNSNARARHIVVHGYGGVLDTGNFILPSEGCPAVSMANISKVTERLKDGSILLIGLSE
jgi:hypothetical protein